MTVMRAIVRVFMVHGILGPGLSSGVATARVVRAQTVQLPPAPSCATCRIELTKVASLGSGDSGFVRSQPLWMARDSRGRFYVTWQNYGHGPELVAVYDSTGRFLQEIGRKGPGPGEFYYPASVQIDRAGQLIIWDTEARESVWDSSYRFVRQYTQRAGLAVVLPSGIRVGGPNSLDRTITSGPISAFDTLGRPLASFGATNLAPIDSDPWRSINRTLAASGSDAVWAARPDMYRIERWTLRGNLTAVLTRSPSWFAPIGQRGYVSRGEAPTPTVRALREDSGGRLWFLISIASANWRDALGPPTSVPGRPPSYRQYVQSAMFDGMIDIIDVRSGRLLVSQRIPGMFLFVLSDNLLAKYRQDADGTPIIEIWRATMRQ